MKKETILKKAEDVKQLIGTGLSAKAAIAKAGLQSWQYYGINRVKNKAANKKTIKIRKSTPKPIQVTEINIPQETNIFAFYGPKEELSKVLSVLR